jgi:hypothetical protein
MDEENVVDKMVCNIATTLANEIDHSFVSILPLVRPAIKGKITKGKLRWRGVSIVHENNGVYLYQRNNNLGRLDNTDFLKLTKQIYG